mmetsp:Transcript_11276/g.25685  ORF Transcript_11276/g.25685 Transcript_11276/m.25685 type:complete len:81 (+) Transcript_11276:47-289(+)
MVRVGSNFKVAQRSQLEAALCTLRRAKSFPSVLEGLFHARVCEGIIKFFVELQSWENFPPVAPKAAWLMAPQHRLLLAPC